jgi:hypothetical protein
MTLVDLVGALGFGPAWGARGLARAMGRERKLRIAALADPVIRALGRAGHEAMRAPLAGGRLGLDDGAADAVCISGLPSQGAPALLGECARVVKQGGSVLVATALGKSRRGPDRHVVAALFLHAGLVEIQQQLARGVVITSGRVRR